MLWAAITVKSSKLWMVKTSVEHYCPCHFSWPWLIFKVVLTLDMINLLWLPRKFWSHWAQTLCGTAASVMCGWFCEAVSAHKKRYQMKLTTNKSARLCMWLCDLLFPLCLDHSKPLAQRQDHLERTVKGYVQKMEDLVHKIHLKSTSKPHNPSVKPDPAMAEIQRQLTEVQAQLKALQQQQQQQQPKLKTKKQRMPEQKAKRRRSLRKALASVPSIDSVLKGNVHWCKGMFFNEQGIC